MAVHEDIDPTALRRALAGYPTGVAIVTSRDLQGRPMGVTVNSFASVSLDPPLVLFSLARRAASCPHFQEASHFAINILAHDQQSLSARFSTPGIDRFSGISISDGLAGNVLIDDTVAHFECAREYCYEGGDHMILVGRVLRFARSERTPLVLHGGSYGTPLPNSDFRPVNCQHQG